MITNVSYVRYQDSSGGTPAGYTGTWICEYIEDANPEPESPWITVTKEDFDVLMETQAEEYNTMRAAAELAARKLTTVIDIRAQAIKFLNQWYDAYHFLRMQIWRTDDADASATGKALVLSIRAWVDSIDTYVMTLANTVMSGGIVTPDFPANIGNPPYTFDQVFVSIKTPTFTSHPSNVTVVDPLPATFMVTTTGYSTRTYQWQRSNDGGTTWSNIVGATSASYTLNPTASGDNGAKFRCKCSVGVLAVATSNVATLTII